MRLVLLLLLLLLWRLVLLLLRLLRLLVLLQVSRPNLQYCIGRGRGDKGPIEGHSSSTFNKEMCVHILD